MFHWLLSSAVPLESLTVTLSGSMVKFPAISSTSVSVSDPGSRSSPLGFTVMVKGTVPSDTAAALFSIEGICIAVLTLLVETRLPSGR